MLWGGGRRSVTGRCEKVRVAKGAPRGGVAGMLVYRVRSRHGGCHMGFSWRVGEGGGRGALPAAE